MRTWIFAFVLAVVAGPAAASGVPPIPGLDETPTPVAPLDRTWPIADADVPMDRVVPPIPAPTVEHRVVIVLPPIPSPDQPMTARSPLTEPWDVTLEVEPRNLPPIPELRLASLDRGSQPVAKLAQDQPANDWQPSPSTNRSPQPPAAMREGFDPDGTVHVVTEGDTLWDISSLYLGTPWIWPSIWQDNEAVANPHLIFPGDKIWVSANEMRKLTDAEAAALMAARPAPEPAPAAMAEDVPSVPMPEKPRETFRFVRHASLGIVSERELDGLGQIVGTIEEKVLLGQGDTVFVNKGEGDVVPGDQFSLFRTSQKVYDPETHKTLGYHSEIVGWLEITKVHGDTARARIQQSYTDFVPGVYLQPRLQQEVDIEILESPTAIEGQIADLMLHQKYRGNGDVVVLNRGEKHGLLPGSTIEVYRPVSGNWKETWYGEAPEGVSFPHEPVATLVVLGVQPKTAMAYVMKSNTEIWYGDRFRTVGGPSVDHPYAGIVSIEARVIRWVRDQGARVAKGAKRAGQRATQNAPKPGVPAMAGWNLPRLQLPELDGYDPR